ncbi:DUF397 domain-containing protein [Streptomyces sp. H27-G5]|uniref:DUF397 domain-containing protein n=1 Tax=Streptomyces sp. H27-G5 TaxID=2996698 RepID=UPI00226DDC76|nr:DUF397 domain-containing protein [Streptomyces sp. H27-G5]MCY0924262.1 DUF397 domain-containing protein [Streptomyces sp. H27-G5]
MSADLVWRKSSYSGGDPDNCVEVAAGDAPVVHVRDTKDHGKGLLTASPAAWSAFLGYAKGGEL